ncbi:hypothetical protein [Paenibacillus xerothermodurans]|nr:hypothetical protein [Paenibacillus xerothermodurans]
MIRLDANGGDTTTHLFDVPSRPDKQLLKEWAAGALQAYGEG